MPRGGKKVSMAPSHRKTIIELGTFLVVLLTYVAPLDKNPHGVRLAQVITTAFLLYLVAPPAWTRLARWHERHGRVKRLLDQWPAFRARVTTFREFFAPDTPSSLGATVGRTATAPAPEYANVLKIQDFLALMDTLSANLAHDVKRVPRMTDAHRIIRDFENLLPRIESRGIRSLVQLTEAKLDGFFTAYAAFRQSYREFAREANVHIGEPLFDGH